MTEPLAQFRQVRDQLSSRRVYDPGFDRSQGVAAELDTAELALSEQLQAIERRAAMETQNEPSGTLQSQETVLPNNAPVTQRFGNYNPGIYKDFNINKSGINTGTDFGVKEGTPLALPPGEWQVVEAFTGAGKGKLGDKTNRGYGNSVLVQNTKTGETLRYSHLQGVNVNPGSVVRGGTVIGTSGASGNVTGAHLDLEYKNAQGSLSDVLQSIYAAYLFGQGGGSYSLGQGGGKAFKDAWEQTRTAYFNAAEPQEGQPVANALRAALMKTSSESDEEARLILTPYKDLSPEDRKKAVDMIIGYTPMGSVKSRGLTRVMHPDDVKFLNETADVLGESSAKNTQAYNEALKNVQALADTYLQKQDQARSTNWIMKTLMKHSAPRKLDI